MIALLCWRTLFLLEVVILAYCFVIQGVEHSTTAAVFIQEHILGLVPGDDSCSTVEAALGRGA